MPTTRQDVELQRLAKLEHPTTNHIMSAILSSNNSLKLEISTLSGNVNSLNASISHITNDLQNVKERVNKTELDVNNMVNELKTTKENIEYLKQRHLQNDIIITGFGPTKFIAKEVVNKLLENFDTPSFAVPNYFVRTVKHAKFNDINQQLIIQFERLNDKLIFSSHYKNSGPLYLNQFTQTTSQNNKRLYINDRLTSYNMNLLNVCIKLKKKSRITFAWHRKGNIYIRISENSPPIPIKSMDDLEIAIPGVLADIDSHDKND